MAMAIICLPKLVSSQETELIDSLPADLNRETLIILKHEKIDLGTMEEDERSKKYVIHRQENHNRVTEEFNRELELAADKYYQLNYQLAFPSDLALLDKQAFKYVLYSHVYDYEYLKSQPNEGELLIYHYVIKDRNSNKVYSVFEIDEMKVYDAKLIMRKLAKEVKKSNP